MKRIELFEFEDFKNTPHFIRTGVTNLLMVFHKLLGTSDVLSKLLLDARKKHDFNQIIDMGSGSGGAMIASVQKMNNLSAEKPVQLILSDKYPNASTIARINNQNLPHIKYHDTSIDALQAETHPRGLKTMIASFHHMAPPIARKILQSAAHNREPILLYELAKNNVPVLLWVLLLPLSLGILVIMALVLTLFVRPLSFQQVVFTYLIPIIPIVYAWDGQASLMRTYTCDDIRTLIGDSENSDYQWDISDALKENGKKAGYFVLGYPKK